MKLLNKLSYFSILFLPYLILGFIFELHIPVKICTCIILLLVIILNIVHWKIKKVKFMGIRILISIIVVFISTIICYYAYGNIKTKQAEKVLSNITKIELENRVILYEDLKNSKITFVNTASIISKGAKKGRVYYNSGSSEEIKVMDPGEIFEIGNNKYFIRNIKK